MRNDDFEEEAREKIEAFKKKIPSRGKMIVGVCLIVLMVAFVSCLGSIVENIDKNDILIVKKPITGSLYVYTKPGWAWQWFGEVTHLKQSFQFWFSAKNNQGKKEDQSIRARFNDNGHGNISGSVRINAPLDKTHILDVYNKFGSQEAVERELIRTVFEKAIYFAGPLMSSTESATSKKNQLISFIEDQAQNGVYKTATEDVKEKDPVTGIDKTVTKVKLTEDKNSPSGFARQEVSPLVTYGYKASNLSINEVKYDKEVEEQISTQQKSIMAVQIAIANAKKAEQDAITAAKNGEAAAAKAKWEQEVIRAKAVTLAEQERDVARLNKEAAEFKKQKDILEGQGEAEKRRLIMQADGGLEFKGQTLERIMGRFAQEFAKQKWVPEIVMGSGGATHGADAVGNFMSMLMMKSAKDLALDMSLPTGATAKGRK